jgi:primosomal protein N' (replication factor Y)
MGPGEPMIARIRNQYLMSILLKLFRGKSDLPRIKLQVQACINTLSAEKGFRNVRWIVDVDPV